MTTRPVITECMFALERNRNAFLDWVVQSELAIIDFGMDDLGRMRRWMDSYRDRRIDFADASLVWLATAKRTDRVATTDFNDFEAYRIPARTGKGKPFKLLIARLSR